MINPRRISVLRSKYPLGLTTAEFIEVIKQEAGLTISVPVLRKYVQLGAVSPSQRCRIDNTLGSQGRYPVMALNQVLRVRQGLDQGVMMEKVVACPVNQYRKRCEETDTTLCVAERAMQAWAKCRRSAAHGKAVARVRSEAKAIRASLDVISAELAKAQ